MGKRQKLLSCILQDNGFNLLYPAEIDKNVFYESLFDKTIQEVYKALGGTLDKYPVRFGDFDITTLSYFIEVDEENHFNRFRKYTLENSFYKNYKYFPVDKYIQFCNEYEAKAGSGGGFWSSPTSEKQFGISSAPKDLSGNGPARWKQRAFYDFLRDVYSKIYVKPVYRFSIYEMIGNVSLNQILKNEKKEYYQSVCDMVSSRIK